ncbi:MAG: hypothetical protein ACK5NG_08685 [Chthoniobacterales bacterium]
MKNSLYISLVFWTLIMFALWLAGDKLSHLKIFRDFWLSHNAEIWWVMCGMLFSVIGLFLGSSFQSIKLVGSISFAFFICYFIVCLYEINSYPNQSNLVVFISILIFKFLPAYFIAVVLALIGKAISGKFKKLRDR